MQVYVLNLVPLWTLGDSTSTVPAKLVKKHKINQLILFYSIYFMTKKLHHIVILNTVTV